MRIIREHAAAVIIDVQERLFPHMHEKDRLSENLCKLVQGLKLLEIPILLMQQYTKGLGETIEPVRRLMPDVAHMEKKAFSCCDESVFMEQCRALAKPYIIVMGIEAHVCVLQTVVDLIAAGYVPVLTEDCVSSRREHDKKIAVERMRSEGAVVTTSESLLFELCRVSGTEVFKEISRLVK